MFSFFLRILSFALLPTFFNATRFLDFPGFNLAMNQSLNGDTSLFAYVPVGDICDTVVFPLLYCDLSKSFILLCSRAGCNPSICSEKNKDKSFTGFKVFNTNSHSSDPVQMIYSQIWQFMYTCSAWPFDAPASAPLAKHLPIMWVMSDFDLNAVLFSDNYPMWPGPATSNRAPAGTLLPTGAY
ncbi:hypothetical protein DFH09DRAFT_1072180 [Mycena vulgaris]|nr:hypothetical protein DFH09DRAFT_1072180 [Mycena vulgaris]